MNGSPDAAKEQRGGNTPKPDGFERGTPDALALWRDAYLESLASRNYAAGTVEGRRDALKLFLAWAAERDLKQAGQITRPILENFQRCLWRSSEAQRPAAGLEHRSATGWASSKTFSAGSPGKTSSCTIRPASWNCPAWKNACPRKRSRRANWTGCWPSPMWPTRWACATGPCWNSFTRAVCAGPSFAAWNWPTSTPSAARCTSVGQGEKRPHGAGGLAGRCNGWSVTCTEIRPRLCLDTRTQALFLTGYGGAVQSRRSQPHGVRLAAAGRAEEERLLPHFAAHLRHPHAGKRGRHPVTSSSCLDTRSWTPPPFTPTSRSNSCRKFTPAAIHPPGSKRRRRPVPPPAKIARKIVLPRPRPNDTVGAWKREQPVPSVF